MSDEEVRKVAEKALTLAAVASAELQSHVGHCSALGELNSKILDRLEERVKWMVRSMWSMTVGVFGLIVTIMWKVL